MMTKALKGEASSEEATKYYNERSLQEREAFDKELQAYVRSRLQLSNGITSGHDLFYGFWQKDSTVIRHYILFLRQLFTSFSGWAIKYATPTSWRFWPTILVPLFLKVLLCLQNGWLSRHFLLQV